MDDLLGQIETFLLQTGMSAREFGRRAMNDTRLVYELRRGRELRQRTARRIRAWMLRHRKSSSGITQDDR